MTQKLWTRRKFIKKTGIGAAGIGLFGGIPLIGQTNSRQRPNIIIRKDIPAYLLYKDRKDVLPRFIHKNNPVDSATIEEAIRNDSSLRDNVDLEFLVNDSSSGNPLSQSSVVLQGISDPDYLQIQETNDQGSTEFSVLDNSFYYYFGFHLGHHSESGSIFSNQNQQVNLGLDPFGPDEWWDYYQASGGLEFSFTSFDPNTNYNVGDEFNYEFQVGSISDSDVGFSNNEIIAGILDINGNQAMTPTGGWWGSPNDLLDYQITFRPRSGWMNYSAEGNLVTIRIGEAHGVFDGIPFDVSGDGEFVEGTLETNDNVIPNVPTGDYNVLFALQDIYSESQFFHVDNPNVGIIDSRTSLISKVTNYPNPANNSFMVHYEKGGELIMRDILGREVYRGTGKDFNVKLNSSGIYYGVIDGQKFKQTLIK